MNQVPAGLNARQVQLLRWRAAGIRQPEVAQRLGISPNAVHKYYQRLDKRLPRT